MHDFPTPDVWLAHRVSYGETDTMGYLYYAEYLHLFERSRSEYIREMGMSNASASCCPYAKPSAATGGPPGMTI